MSLPDVENFEVKLAFHPKDTDVAIAAFGLTDSPREEKRIHFFDTKGLACFKKNLILRARQTVSGDDPHDLTLKLRGVIAPDVAKRFPGANGSKFEGDKNVGKDATPSFSITVVPKKKASVHEVVDGTKSFRSAVSDEAEMIMREMTHPEIANSSIKALGPIESRGWKLKPEDFDDGISAELWMVNGFSLLEFSGKVARSEVKKLEKKFAKLLADSGLRQLAKSKTLFALEALT